MFAKPSPIFASHQICAQDLYDPIENPHGYLNLGTAENRLVWNLLEPKLNAACQSEEADSHYGPIHGHPALHSAMSKFLERSFGVQLEPQRLVIGNGATAIIDMLGFALCEPGEAFLVPAPYYPGFDDDLAGRSQVTIVPAYLKSETGFAINREVLNLAWDRATLQGMRIRALLITSPSNPLGRTLDAAEMDAALTFAAEKNIHCIFDEIYAHSRFPDVPFNSVLSRISAGQRGSENVHVIYGMAKDFSLAGYRIGVFYSQHAELLTAMRKLSYFATTSLASQRQAARLLQDTEWVADFLQENGRRLQAAYNHLTTCFAPISTAHAANAGVFAWVSLAKYLHEPTLEGEKHLHQRMMRDAKVNILPGHAFHCGEPGWFRICYANEPHRVALAAERLKMLLLASSSETK